MSRIERKIRDDAQRIPDLSRRHMLCKITPWTIPISIVIVSTIHSGGCVIIGFVLTIGFDDCLLIEIAHTIEFGDCPLIEMARQLFLAIVYELDLSRQ